MKRTARRILVVDDNLDTLQLLRLTLENAGYQVSTAASWDDVTRVLRELFEEKQQVDLILLDLMIPERSGFDILRSLQVMLRPMPPVVVLSAKSGFQDRLTAREMGVSEYLIKPTDRQTLLKTIKSVLRS